MAGGSLGSPESVSKSGLKGKGKNEFALWEHFTGMQECHAVKRF
jgi:hypothetical protein